MLLLFLTACITVVFLYYSVRNVDYLKNNETNKNYARRVLPNGLYHSQESKASLFKTISITSYAQFPLLKWRSSVVDFANLHLKYNLSMPLNLDVCANATYFVFVPTRPSAFEIRAVIRETWAKKPPANFLYRFVVGKPNKTVENNEIFNNLYKEWKQFSDIIFYDAKDEYRMLHVKIYAVLTWQQLYCSNVQFVIRADADTIIDLDRLQYWMHNGLVPDRSENSSIIFGYLDHVSQIKRNPKHKHYVSYKDYPSNQIPPYASGFFHGISNEAVKSILSVSHTVNGFSVDDLLFTGVLAEKAGVKLVNATKYLTIFRKQGDEKCNAEDNMPPLTVYCCVNEPEELARRYAILKNLTCSES